ncbi:MAG: cupin domain-containing protein [Candidatus Cloacimonetes bacterium]|nr:cupin domain-containing protein [Candidatus Cloacimonadota bacterium]
MKINQITLQEPFFSQDKIKAWKVFSGNESEQILMYLEPDAILKPHQTEFDLNLLVLKGKLNFILENESYQMNENETAECQGDIPHGLENPFDNSATILLTKIFKK